MNYSAKDVRNVAIVGHSGAGKTSLAEAILFNGKSIDRLGKVDTGTSVMDFEEQEISRKISISLSTAYTVWNGVKINIIDVPGFFDFEAEVEQAMRAVGSAILVADASGEVAVGAEKMIEYSLRNKIPMIIFINGIDKENADYQKTVQAFKNVFGKKNSGTSRADNERRKNEGLRKYSFVKGVRIQSGRQTAGRNTRKHEG